MMGGKHNQVTAETCLNKLPFSVIRNISNRLDIDKKWERFVSKIPRRMADVGKADCEMRYSHLQIRLFEDKGRRQDGSPSKSIIDDWSTQLPKVKHLIRVLQEADLYEAADYLSENVLQVGKVERLHTADEPPSLPGPVWSDDKLSKGNIDESYEKHKYYVSKVDEYNLSPSKPYSDGKSIDYSELASTGGENSYDKLQPSSLSSGDNKISYFSGGPSFEGKAINSRESSEQPESGSNSQMCFVPKDPMFQLPVSEDPPYDYAKPPEKNVLFMDEGDYCRQQVIYERQKNVRKEPCESSDVVLTSPSSTNSDIYKLIGPQRQMDYSILQHITDNFKPGELVQGGRVIGSGGFGEVYLGVFENGHKVAVKKLKNVDEVDKQFRTELEALTKHRHKNIVCLYAYSVNGPDKCLVYEYLCNGSLEDRLHRRGNTPPLSVKVRLSILSGTAEGIVFLNEQGIVHRDIKSPNVLLDEDFNPKVGDFATARAGPQGNTTAPMSTRVVIGTSAYLAPEAMNFDVSTKLDSWSFGIIILEMLTAAPALDSTREEKDLKSYTEENDMYELLDNSGGEWPKHVVAQLTDISERCSQRRKKQRVNVVDILSELQALCMS
ncbi:interleukin-1 receptor-associated kinase 4-like [Mya arenaria]|nr:interleukin-1 receptor-associated kinase 4-like [Mya arenaria]